MFRTRCSRADPVPLSFRACASRRSRHHSSRTRPRAGRGGRSADWGNTPVDMGGYRLCQPGDHLARGRGQLGRAVDDRSFPTIGRGAAAVSGASRGHRRLGVSQYAIPESADGSLGYGEMAARHRGRCPEAQGRRVASVSPQVGDGTQALAYWRCRRGRRLEAHPYYGRVLRAIGSGYHAQGRQRTENSGQRTWNCRSSSRGRRAANPSGGGRHRGWWQRVDAPRASWPLTFVLAWCAVRCRESHPRRRK